MLSFNGFAFPSGPKGARWFREQQGAVKFARGGGHTRQLIVTRRLMLRLEKRPLAVCVCGGALPREGSWFGQINGNKCGAQMIALILVGGCKAGRGGFSGFG